MSGIREPTGGAPNEQDERYEDGYVQALRDLRVYHQQVIDDGAGFDEATGHREAIRFLDGLIATKERRRGQQR